MRLLFFLSLLLLPTALRSFPAAEPGRCAPEGRGVAPRTWLGCAADAGPRRGLSGDERLLLGLPLDPNRAGARELSFLPGLSRSLAAEVVRERTENGPFDAVAALRRVRGIGPKRLARVSPFLEVATHTASVAEAIE
jgi:competence protein ComEA